MTYFILAEILLLLVSLFSSTSFYPATVTVEETEEVEKKVAAAAAAGVSTAGRAAHVSSPEAVLLLSSVPDSSLMTSFAPGLSAYAATGCVASGVRLLMFTAPTLASHCLPVLVAR